MEQARAADDKIVVEFSVLGQALPNGPRSLGWALSRTAHRYNGACESRHTLDPGATTGADTGGRILYLLEHPAFHPNLHRRSKARHSRDQPRPCTCARE